MSEFFIISLPYFLNFRTIFLAVGKNEFQIKYVFEIGKSSVPTNKSSWFAKPALNLEIPSFKRPLKSYRLTPRFFISIIAIHFKAGFLMLSRIFSPKPSLPGLSHSTIKFKRHIITLSKPQKCHHFLIFKLFCYIIFSIFIFFYRLTLLFFNKSSKNW